MKTLSHREIGAKYGLDPGLDLSRVCADFYLLESMASDKYREAEIQLDRLMSVVLPQFHNYLRMVVWGELRYYGKVHDCYNNDCEADENGDPLPHDAWQPSPELRALRDELTGFFEDRPPERESAWTVFPEVLAKCKHPRPYYIVQRLFEDEYGWSGNGYGGHAWAGIARLVDEYDQGNIKPTFFLNQAFTLEHNGGCIFNKFYSKIDGLRATLDCQFAGDYDRLAREYASKTIRDLWLFRPAALGWRLGPRAFTASRDGRDPAFLGYEYAATEHASVDTYDRERLRGGDYI